MSAIEESSKAVIVEKIEESKAEPDIVKLIEEVKSERSLYDKAEKKYLDNTHKSKVWSTIARKTGFEGLSFIMFLHHSCMTRMYYFRWEESLKKVEVSSRHVFETKQEKESAERKRYK